jgi:predicted nucleotidyltransferase component of viral defense system
VITRAVLDERVREWGLRDDVVEKDYVLGWLLWGIGSNESLGASWVFKGGTCLKKCYIETYRFSEDPRLHCPAQRPNRARRRLAANRRGAERCR